MSDIAEVDEKGCSLNLYPLQKPIYLVIGHMVLYENVMKKVYFQRII